MVLVLCEHGVVPLRTQALLAELGHGANLELVAVPSYKLSADRASRDPAAAAAPWSRLVERSMTEDLHVMGYGLAGIHAMAFLPRRTAATAIVDDSDQLQRALACMSGTQARLVVSEAVLASMHPEGKTKPLAAGYHLVEEGTACSAWRAKAGAADAR